jgi:hypothetical protein
MNEERVNEERVNEERVTLTGARTSEHETDPNLEVPRCDDEVF